MFSIGIRAYLEQKKYIIVSSNKLKIFNMISVQFIFIQ